ncbi:MAG: helix-turn-helix domain-containing protein [Desulfohalobiaceae bacterium]|nr:helix-turn-helix domain-containing protein [Desulfohalobiaceae bacterium]
MTLDEIGRTLKEERKRQGLSLEDVYATTKIGVDILRAIEEGDPDDLPPFVYARGFVRNYAGFLGLSAEELVRDFDSAVQEDAGPGTGTPRAHAGGEQQEGSRRDRFRTRMSVVFIVLLLILLVWLVYYFFFSPPPADRTVPGQGPEVTENATQGEEVSGPGRASGENRTRKETDGRSADREQGAPSFDAAENGTPRNQSAAEGTRVSANRTTEEASENRTTEETSENRTAEEGVSQEPAGHVLRVAAYEACWLRVELNGQSRDLYLDPGEERRFRFRETGYFLLGNAGGVALFLDGDKLSLQAESGEVKEITLP